MAKRKLLDAIRELSSENLAELESISSCVADRLSWLELREPDYDSSEWNDKYDMLSDASDALEEAIEIYEELEDFVEQEQKDKLKEIQDRIEDAVSNINCIQSLYGGMSRLNL